MFYTDDLRLCLDRARARQLAGDHAVDPLVVEAMYNNTLSLIEVNEHLIDRLQLINVTLTSVELIYSRRFSSSMPEFILDTLPTWSQSIVKNGRGKE